MTQELAEGDGVAGALIGEPEVGQVGDDGGVEVEHALVYERHDEGGGVDLGDGADREEGVGADGVARLEAGDAIGTGLALATRAARQRWRQGRSSGPSVRGYGPRPVQEVMRLDSATTVASCLKAHLAVRLPRKLSSPTNRSARCASAS